MQISNPFSLEPSQLAELLNPFEDGPLTDFTSGPALSACLPAHMPLPPDAIDDLHLCLTSTGEQKTSVIVVTVIIGKAFAFHWFLDASDVVTWNVLDAWDEQGGFQILVHHEGEDATVPLVQRLPEGVNLGSMFADMRRTGGQDRTIKFLALASLACGNREMEKSVRAYFPYVVHQGSFIVATPKVALCAEAFAMTHDVSSEVLH
ncbi:hypothetical protein [Burkholderia sp. 9120]|uniref:hypothetical protein n=1 Tax=Burkholderia sp. 9120 TaxID=1500897 RepID=UPI0005592657|nr:hypothetical protein [Burkholderia sp. 9120]